ncbi:MAG: DUF3593 domain-containing protein [Synechococcaceae cyanobacterium]|nr:DUF3593 domain-containing protein [Synechococcaceae cyanobacterium]
MTAIEHLWQWLCNADPTPWFVASLLPYLAFLRWASRVQGFPRLARSGFQLTLLFVAVTIAAAVIAQQRYGRLLADVDPLHGGAEAFLTLSNLLVLVGFAAATPAPPPVADQQVLQAESRGRSAPEDGASAPDP